jgi:hypothetical protein
MTTDCSICCETFNRLVHQKVTCSFCDHSCCKKCVQTYLLNTSNDPHCMQCKNAWNREFVDQSCSKTFRNKELRAHRENILLEREKCLMPETQVFVVHRKRALRIKESITGLTDQIGELTALRQILDNQMARLNAGDDVGEVTATKAAFVRKCPVEDCRGFLSTKWKCEVCDHKICKDCNEIKDDGDGEPPHVCDPGNVETVALLKKDTKPCPSCGTLIFRISGCAQMWCPNCHGAFNWNTGRIEQGIIHNPHYYEFQQRNGTGGRVLGDIPCGGFPNVYEMNEKFNPGRYDHRHGPQQPARRVEPYEKMLMACHRMTGHITDYELRYNYRNIDIVPENRHLRVSYLMNEISENQLKSTIQKKEKAFEKRRDIANVLRMFADTAGDLFRQFVTSNTDIEDTLYNLMRYCNTCFEQIHVRYNCVTPFIDLVEHNLFSKNYK